MIKPLKKNWPLWTALLIFVVHFVLSYYGQWRYDYPVAPGDDIYNHLSLIDALAKTPTFFGAGGYAPGFHYLVVGLSIISGLDHSEVLVWLWPALLIISGLSIWFLANRVFGRTVGVVAYGLYALVSLQPLQTATDGTLANLLAGNIFLPLTLAYWHWLWVENGRLRLKPGMFVAALCLLILYTHHLSSIISFTVLFLSGVVLGTDLLWRDKRAVRRFVFLWVAAATGIFVTVWTSPLADPIKSLLITVGQVAGEEKSWALSQYFTRISWVVSLFAFAGGAWLLIQILKKKVVDQKERLGSIIILVWAAVYFFGSLTSRVGEPERLGRDFAMPGVILAAYLIIFLLKKLTGNKRLIVLAAVLVLTLHGIAVKTTKEIVYNPMVRFSTADVELTAMLKRGAFPERTYVWPRNPMWAYHNRDQIIAEQILVLDLERSIEQAAKQEPGCLLVSVYQPGSWPPDLVDDEPIMKLEETFAQQRVFILEDDTKVWYSLCKEE